MRYFVIPVKTGIQLFHVVRFTWIPACAGMTLKSQKKLDNVMPLI